MSRKDTVLVLCAAPVQRPRHHLVVRDVVVSDGLVSVVAGCCG